MHAYFMPFGIRHILRERQFTVGQQNERCNKIVLAVTAQVGVTLNPDAVNKSLVFEFV